MQVHAANSAYDPAGTNGASSVGERTRGGGNGSGNSESLTAAASIGGERAKPIGAELNAAIARAIVRIHRNTVGRGPTKAHAFFHHNIVVVVLEEVLIKAERTLLAEGDDDSVIRLRQKLLETMRPDLIAAVERLTDRHVTALIGGTEPKPDAAGHVFMLDRPIQTQPAGATGDAALRHRSPQPT
jgi:uncharacterized protein YbcI